VLHTRAVTTTPAPPPGQPGPTPAVPYGPGPTADVGDEGSPSIDVSAKSVGRTALKWGLRLAVPFLLRAIFRGLAGR
jgi:hypothetical protein